MTERNPSPCRSATADELVGEVGVDGHVGGEWAKQFVMSHLLFQIWQEMHKQSIPLNDDNSASSRILQGVWEIVSPYLQRFE